MKILLIAYEFPPSPSPQSLRWVYLSRELVLRGHDVHVLTPDLGPELGDANPALHQGVVVHRTYAGPMRGFIAWHRRRRAAAGPSPTPADAANPGTSTPVRPQRTSLKIRLVNTAYRLSEWIWFPDIRGEWRPFAKRALRRLLAAGRYEAVITSHEPATCLQLGLDVRGMCALPWIADMGDPVLAPYTPRRWRRRAARLERETCRTADVVTVTAASAAALMQERHGPMRAPVVLTQGFGERAAAPLPASDADLELVYAGSFYSFRRAEALFEAVAACDGVRLSVATVALPEPLRAIAEANPRRFRLLGFLAHSEALDLQATAHVLVNIANRDATQVPGKLYEYFGAGRPVLHLTHGDADPGADLVRALRRGWVVQDDRASIVSRLQDLRARMTHGDWLAGIDLGDETVRPYAWTTIGDRLDALLHEVAKRGD